MSLPDDDLLRTVARSWDRRADAFDDEPDHGLTDPVVRSAWDRKLRSWLPPPPAQVVDLGCGTGSLTVLLAQQGHHVTGADLSPNMIELARQKAIRNNVPARFLQMDAANPALEAGAFDAVLVRHLVWTLADPHQALRRWVRLLRAGGRLILVEGRWKQSGEAPAAGDYQDILGALPWHSGVPAATLAGAVRPMVGSLRVEDLAPDADLWGRPVQDERYAVIASVDELSVAG